MAVTKPLASRSPQLPHTGHGAASIIPHLTEREPIAQLQDPGADEAASGDQQGPDDQGTESPGE